MRYVDVRTHCTGAKLPPSPPPSDGENTCDQYLCEECQPRRVSPEVPMTPQPPDAPNTDKYFITLLRDSLQVKQGE